ncbi:MAG: BatD family protein [Alphaproteobacteria bacterium]|nr:BatD family protein [Alphaproteobacteria bacterium]
MKKTGFMAFFCILLMSAKAMCAVSASVDRETVGLNEMIFLSIKTDQNVANLPDLTDILSGFRVVSTAVSQKNFVSNMRQSRSVEFKIGLIPTATGKQIIPAIDVAGERTQPIEITVTDEAVGATPSISLSTPENKAVSGFGIEALIKNPAQKYFVQQQIDYQIVVTDDGSIIGGQVNFEPTNDFIIKSVREPYIRQSANGRQIFYDFALFSQKSGSLTLPNAVFEGYSYEEPDAKKVFDVGFFAVQMPSIFGVKKPVFLSKKGNEIEILPAPSDFEGGWWLPSTNVRLEENFTDIKQSVRAFEPIAREVVLSAEGVLETQLPQIEFEDAPDFKQYVEEPVLETRLVGNKIVATQKTTITYIPQKEGKLELPEIGVEWFDVSTDTIKKETLKKVVVDVQKNPNVATENLSGGPKENAKTETNGVSLWLVIAAFLVGVLMSFAISKKTSSPQKPAKKKDISKTIRTADLKTLQNNVLNFSRQKFKNQNFNSLQDVALFLGDDDFFEAAKALSTCLYSGKKTVSFDRSYFEDSFKKALKKKKNKTKDDDVLPPLYQ